MATHADVCKKQRAVIEVLVLEGERTAAIHNRLKNVYGDNTLDVSNVRRWVRRIKGSDSAKGEALLVDQPRSGRPAHAVPDINLKHTDELIKQNRKIRITEINEALDISRGSTDTLVGNLGYSKVCAKCVPRQLTDTMKQQRVEASTELLSMHAEDETFLQRITTGDETWVHHYEPESKRRSMEWRHADSPRKKKFKSQPSAGKVMATETLRKLKTRIKRCTTTPVPTQV